MQSFFQDITKTSDIEDIKDEVITTHLKDYPHTIANSAI